MIGNETGDLSLSGRMDIFQLNIKPFCQEYFKIIYIKKKFGFVQLFKFNLPVFKLNWNYCIEMVVKQTVNISDRIVIKILEFTIFG